MCPRSRPRHGTHKPQFEGAGPAPTSPKVGRAEAWGIVLFSTGDASISAAMQNGGITRVHHVDHETQNILGFWSKYTTIVYGE
jgi:hypothetical protein